MRKTTTVVKVANPQRNPVLAALRGLAGANPQGGSMKKKKKNAAPKSKSAKRNPKTVAGYVTRPATSKSKKNGRRRHGKRSRNPEIMGVRVSSADLVMALLAGLGGVTITKLVTPQLPAGLVESTAGRVLASGAVAVGAGMLAAKVNPKAGLAMAFGGGMQAMSVALNGYLPKLGSQIALSGVRRRPGMGMLIDTPWVPVFNPLAGTPSAAGAPMLPAAPGASTFVDPADDGPYKAPY